MTKIVFISHDGNETCIDANDGESVMETAVANNVDGIVAECGGACACATCHVFVEAEFRGKVGEPNEMEAAMLEFNENKTCNSRLSCQIEVSPALEGLRLRLPECQY